MKTVCSHTLVKNGMPFIGLVLRKVVPYMDRCIITISEKADKDTFNEVESFKKDFGSKVTLLTENVSKPDELTNERQKMLDMTGEDWVLFLDDDDYWPDESIKMIQSFISLNNYVDGLAFNPIQLIDKAFHDWGWRYKWFTKWFPNVEGLHYIRPWPQDILMINERPLYWRQNPMVLRMPVHFFHLSHIKEHSFRNECWAKPKWGEGIGEGIEILEEHKQSVQEIYDWKSRDSRQDK
jgi:hypothetical protein